MAEEVYSNDAQTVVISGGASAAAGGSSETWIVATPRAFPISSSTAPRPTTFHVADPAFPTEVIAVTDTSGASWTVTRGAEGSTPVAHSPGFIVKQVVTGGVLANLRDAPAVFNVKTEFLAAGDGVAVDSAAFNNAVTALNATGGGTLLVPAGTYVMSNVTFGSNITVRGAGIGATVFLMDPAAASGAVVCRVAPASQITATSNMVLRDLSIDGNKDRWGPDSNQKGYGYYLGSGHPGADHPLQVHQRRDPQLPDLLIRRRERHRHFPGVMLGTRQRLHHRHRHRAQLRRVHTHWQRHHGAELPVV